MKKLLEKEIYETPVVMEISPVSFVTGQATDTGEPDTGGTEEPIGGGNNDYE